MNKHEFSIKIISWHDLSKSVSLSQLKEVTTHTSKDYKYYFAEYADLWDLTDYKHYCQLSVV